MLKAMNRHTNKKEVYELLSKIKKEIPESIIRTTFMVGFQGETEEDFKELMECVKTFSFDRLGAFTYSKEEDTKGFEMAGDVPEIIKKARYNKLMKLQKQLLKTRMQARIGQIVEVIVEDVTYDEQYFECRSYMDAPDVDPKMYIKLNDETKDIIIGEYYKVKIESISGYDYICSIDI